MVVAGLSGVVLLVIGLIAFGLTLSPRPSSISSDLYGRMKQLEMVIAVLFIALGMLIVRFAVVKFSKPPGEQ